MLRSINRLNKETLAHFTRILLQQIKRKIDTKLAYISAKWWRVKLEKNCIFVGKIYFRRTPGSSITIGEHSNFLSSFSSNLHGLNRHCMLSTLREEAKIVVGKNVGMSGTVIASAVSITIGDRVFCGANTTITDTDSHSLDYRDRVPGAFVEKPKNWKEPINIAEVVIEDDVFLGMNVIVLKGVTIGKGTVVGAGSIVTHDLPSYVIAAGQPAKVILSLKDKFADIESGHVYRTSKLMGND